MRRIRTLTMFASVLALAASAGAPAAATVSHGPIVALNANQSTNWGGYNQGTLEKTPNILSPKLFNSITGDWTVPTATHHSGGPNDQYSSAWIGIGGGCVNSNCSVTDPTLIQVGTEQDVHGNTASYSAWWELIPGPSIGISNFPVRPGDHMHASITELVANSEVWTIQLQNVTTGQSFSLPVAYSSTHLTAEWIVETPLIIGTGAGFSSLPDLTKVTFTNATTNGAPAQLVASE
jgi:Peptidase A4 family